MKDNLTGNEKAELNKIGNTEDLMGEKSTEESLFGNKKINAIRKSLIKKGFLDRIEDGKVELSEKGWKWYYARL